MQWNEGCYEVQYGGALTPTVKKVSDTLDGDVDITVEVGALSQLLMGTLTARDLAFEGKLSANEEWLEFFDILYPEQKHILTNGGNMSWKTYTVKKNQQN